jgi:WD40 repeat protein
VTCLAWHPALPSHALSGGEDGLVNVYDCSVAGEHEALVSTLSVGDSVSHFGVFGPSGALAHVATRAGALSLWNLGSAAKLADFGGALRAGLPSCHYLLSAHYAQHSDRLVALAGGDDGTRHGLDVTRGGCALRGSLRAWCAINGRLRGWTSCCRCVARWAV